MLLKALSEAIGVSGREDVVRNLLRDQLQNHVDTLETDVIGNLYCYKNWSSEGPRILLAAHMDEVGLMVTKIEKDGFLRFRPVGSVDPRVLVSKPVVIGEAKVPGVIGAKPIHLQERDERKQALDYKDLFVDIGVSSDEEAKKLVSLGDLVAFTTKYQELPGGVLKGKAFDDRAGCAVLAEVLQKDYSVGVVGVFTVQEEVGFRGAQVVGQTLQPDIAIVLEGTTAADVPEIEEHGQSTKMGAGPALTLMDGSVMPHRPTVEKLKSLSDQLQIPIQYRRGSTGSTDAGVLQRGSTGVKTAVLSIPCRYIHSPVSLLAKEDLVNAVQLVEAFIRAVEKEGVSA